MDRDTDRFWAGDFGNAYTDRNKINPLDARVFFERIRRQAHLDQKTIASVIEFGANKGHNLTALGELWALQRCPLETTGVEVNLLASETLLENADNVLVTSFLDLAPTMALQADLVLTKGLLIHIDPADLPTAYRVIAQCAKRYVLMAEYFCPTPRPIRYRSFDGKLWARDFAGEFMDTYHDFELRDYGFVYARDPHPQDNLHWFLMERKA